MAAYERWRSSSEAAADAAVEAKLIEMLLEFKAEQLHCLDPGMWSPQTILQLFLDLDGRNPVLTQGQIALIRGAVLSYFAFLEETKRWHTCAGSVEVASLLVGSFSAPVRESRLVGHGLPGPVRGSAGGGAGEEAAPGLVDRAVTWELLEQLVHVVHRLQGDMDLLLPTGSVAGGRDEPGEADDEQALDSQLIAFSVLEGLASVREMLDLLESDLSAVAALR